MSEVTGGPAYPCGPSGGCGPWDGMTLRDYFAAKALQSLLASGWAHDQSVKIAWEIANAMIEMRKEAHSG